MCGSVSSPNPMCTSSSKDALLRGACVAQSTPSTTLTLSSGCEFRPHAEVPAGRGVYFSGKNMLLFLSATCHLSSQQVAQVLSRVLREKSQSRQELPEREPETDVSEAVGKTAHPASPGQGRRRPPL